MKNAQAVDKKTLKVRFSKMDKAVAELLKDIGFLKKVEIKGRMPKRNMELVLNTEVRPIQGVRFSSTPSVRRYTGFQAIRTVRGGYGVSVLSTSSGIMTGSGARKKKVGGQRLFEIW